MEIKEFLQTLKSLKLSLGRDGEKLYLKGNENELTEDEINSIKENSKLIGYIKENKTRLIDYMQRLEEYFATKKADNMSSMYRLSGLQEGMLFHKLYGEQMDAYVLQFSCDLVDVDREKFWRSWEHLLKRHSILRSSFHYDELNIPVQCVYREVKLPMEELDWRGSSETQQAAALEQYLEKDRERGFDFKQAPLTRVGLIRLSEDRYRMIWTLHHILVDGWSLPVLMGEFLQAYERLSEGEELQQGEEDRYEEYIRYLERREKGRSQEYWRGYLSGMEEGCLLPFVRLTGERTRGGGVCQEQELRLSGEWTAAVERYAQRQRVTVNTVMQGVWSYLLHRYTGRADICYGVTVSGRPGELRGVEERVGLYINTLPLRSRLSQEDRIAGWLKGIQQEQLESREHQYNPLPEIQGWTGIGGDLFDTLLVFENFPVSEVVASRSWQLKVEQVRMHQQSNYPLTITIVARKEIHIQFSYNRELLQAEEVSRIRGHFEQVLQQLVSGSGEECVTTLELLHSQEHAHLLVLSQGEAAAFPSDRTVVELFETQVDNTPDATALIFGEQSLSYRELDERSTQLGRYLRQCGVGPDTLVPVMMDRGLEMIIGILGILKAGGAYVPIDPDYPSDRIQFMLEDSGARLLVSSTPALRGMDHKDYQLILLDEHWPLIAAEPSDRMERQAGPEQLAYVIYTSGSTGRPKGVMIEHRSLVNYLLNNKTNYISEQPDPAGSGSYLHLSFSFDASLTALFLPLVNGRRLVIADQTGVGVFQDATFKQYGPYDFIKLTPAHLSLLAEQLGASETAAITQRLVVGGEALLRSQLSFLLAAGVSVKVINEYGPTEATVGCSTYEVDTKDEVSEEVSGLSIGRPMDNVRMYILDKQMQLVPAGVEGEICIGGAGVSRGYWRRGELTAERFIADPFSEERSARLYRTGDRGYWLADGNIEYVGRRDEQVKIRGYRVELGEIEGVLHDCSLVRQCVVVARQNEQGEKRLIGYVVPEGSFDREEILAYAKERLPEYMVPVVWMELEQLPLTGNGKIDRKALPDLQTNIVVSKQYIAPRNKTEEELAAIWMSLLTVTRIGVLDDFFESGGNSILAIRMLVRIKKKFSVSLSIRTLFQLRNIAALAEYLEIEEGPEEGTKNMEFDVYEL